MKGTFLTKEGTAIYERIKKQCEAKNIWKDIFDLELMMLANSLDLYSRCAKECNKDGATQKPKGGGWDQVNPAYTIMKNEYQNILKHAPKFGLNPTDALKVFGKEENTESKLDL